MTTAQKKKLINADFDMFIHDVLFETHDRMGSTSAEKLTKRTWESLIDDWQHGEELYVWHRPHHRDDIFNTYKLRNPHDPDGPVRTYNLALFKTHSHADFEAKTLADLGEYIENKGLTNFAVIYCSSEEKPYRIMIPNMKGKSGKSKKPQT